jgi:hypothetical protein
MVGDWRSEKTLLFKDSADNERFLGQLSHRNQSKSAKSGSALEPRLSKTEFKKIGSPVRKKL